MSSDEEYESDEFIKSSNLGKKKNVTQKKRGRPKKNELITKPVTLITPEQSEEEEEEEIILQLPLSDDEIESSSDKNGFTMKDESPKKNGVTKFIDSISDESNEGSKMSTKQLINELKKKDEMVKKMRDAMVNMRKNTYGNLDLSSNVKSRIINMKLLNINKNNETIIVDKTDIACWWCAHNFNSLPCFIPERFCDGKYYVFGCFCTYSCALAYNMNMNDYRVSGRVSLIKKMCTEIFGNANVKIAPPKELLIMFGGDMTIEDFRNQALLHKKEFKVKIPPLIPLLMSVEENQRN